MDATVEVENDGTVGITLSNFGSEPLILSPQDLTALVAFVATHGQITI